MLKREFVSQERLMKRRPLGLMKWCNESFTIIQNFLTAIAIPFLALIIGICSFPWNLYFFQDY